MNVGVLGTGMVGQTIASRLVSLGHDVRMGARDAANERAEQWAAGAGAHAGHGTFADAAAFGVLLVNATAGATSLDALGSAGPHLAGKVLLDVANPLDFSGGMPPTLTVCNTDSLGEQIQRTFPDTRVVKALNTVNAGVMVDPALVPGHHTIFVCGDDEAARQQVRALLGTFGWPDEDILDLGDIAGARATEMYLALWLRLWGATGTGTLNVEVRTAGR